MRLIVYLLTFWSTYAQAYSANKVYYEFLAKGHWRVIIHYTVPELKEYREARVDFATKKEAEAFYWDVVRGADFYLDKPKDRAFTKPPLVPRPWAQGYDPSKR